MSNDAEKNSNDQSAPKVSAGTAAVRARSSRAAKFKVPTHAPVASSTEGFYILENTKGETVRTFRWSDNDIKVIYRHDNRRIETHSNLKELEASGVSFDILAESTQAKLKKSAIEIGAAGRLKWVPQIAAFPNEFDLATEETLGAKKAVGWSAGIQLTLAGLIILAGLLSGKSENQAPVTVTLLNQDAIQKIINEENSQPKPQPPETPVERQSREHAQKQLPAKKIVVAASETKLKKNAPVPTHSTSFKHTARATAKGLRGGGYRQAGVKRGYGTNEEHMNQIGALGALTGPTVKGGNGGHGGLNLQAVGNEKGSGAGGKGFGGFGSNGGGGHGLGGLGTGHGSGLANAMYGKGLIAAPFGDGSPAPGSGGYGTRGRMGGGAQGAGYGSETVVGSWKGTGPKGNGPAGSGVGNGDPNGSPFGSVDGDDEDAIVTGGLDMEQIRMVINRNIGQIRYCYEQGLQKEPHLSGRVTVRFQIGGGGRVSLANVRNSSVHSAAVEGCIASKVHGWQFPKPQGGVSVAVTYPFLLNRTVSMR